MTNRPAGSGFIIEASGAAKYGSDLVQAGNLTYPLVIPHRGAGQHIHPQGSIEAYLMGAAMGVPCVDGGDLRMLADGSFVDFHDTDLSTTTTASGDPWNMQSAAQMRLLNAKPVTSFPAAAVGPLTDWREIARRLGGKVVLTPEIKRDGTNPPALGVQGTAFAALLRKQGLTKSVMLGSFYLPELQPALAVGVECAYFIIGDATTTANINAAQAAAAAGCKHVYTTSTGGANAPSSVAAIKVLGCKVGVAVLNRQFDWTAWKAAGADECRYENPIYLLGDPTKYRQSADSFAWHLPARHDRRRRDRTQQGHPLERPLVPLRERRATLWGQFAPFPSPVGQSVTFTVCFDAIGTDTTRHADIVLAVDDQYFDAAVPRSVDNGHILAVRPRAAAQLQLYEVVNGAVTSKAAVTGTEVAAPLALSSALPTSAITALPVAAVPAAIPSGTQFKLPTGELVTTSGATASGATSVAINTVTPTAAVASGTSVPQALRIKLQRTSTTQLVATRLDTGAAATATVSSSSPTRTPARTTTTARPGCRCPTATSPSPSPGPRRPPAARRRSAGG